MTTRHYHVIENTPGYLPDDDSPFVTTRKSEAQSAALDLARDLREQGYKVSGNRVDGYYGELNANDLGRAIEIHECTDATCLQED